MPSKKKPAKPSKPKPTKTKESPVPEPEAVNPDNQDPVEPVKDPEAPVAPEVASEAQEHTEPEAEPQEPTATPEAEPSDVHAQSFVPALRDPRLPEPGSVIQRIYKGRNYTVTVTEGGFLFDGKEVGSLSALARVITGQSVNGFVWWGLGHKDGKSRSGAGTAARLAAKSRKIEGLIVRLKTAVQDGQAALAEAEAEAATLREKAEQLTPKAE